MAIINAPRGPSFWESLGQNLIQQMARSQELQLQQEQMDLEERRVSAMEQTQALQQEQMRTQMAQQAADREAQGQAAQTQLQLMAAQDPSIAAALMQQAGAAPQFGTQPTGAPGIGAIPSLRGVDTQNVDPATARALAPALQEQREFEATVEAQEATTEARRAETALATSRLEFEKSIRGLRQRELEARIEADEASAEASRASIRQGYLELGAGMADQLQSRYATTLANALRVMPADQARAFASVATYQTPTPPDGEELSQRIGEGILQLANNDELDEDTFTQMLSAQFFGQPKDRYARMIGLGPKTQLNIEGQFSEVDPETGEVSVIDNPQELRERFNQLVERATSRIGQQDPQTGQIITEEVVRSQLGAMKSYVDYYTGQHFTLPEFDTDEWYDSLGRFLRESGAVNMAGGATAGAIAGSPFGGVGAIPGSAIGGFLGLMGGAGMNLIDRLSGGKEEENTP